MTKSRHLSILFIGTSSLYSLYPLEALAKNYSIRGIVESAPLDPHSRFPLYPLWINFIRWMGPNSLWRYAKFAKIPYFYYQRKDLVKFRHFLLTHPAEIGVVASMNQLIPKEALSLLPDGFINLHPSLLPDLRGPHVWTWYYYYDDRLGGVTVHRLDEGVDSGDILNQLSFPIPIGMPPDQLVKKSIHLGTRLLLATLQDISREKTQPKPQLLKDTDRKARRVNKNEDLFPFRFWSLEHSFHFLQGARPWFSPFPIKEKSFGFLDWVPTRFFHTPIDKKKIGLILLDRQGFYFVHPEGKIRLRLQVNRLNMLLAVLFILAIFNLLLSR